MFVRALRVGWTNSAMAAQFDRIKAPAARETTASGLLSRQSSNAAEILPPGVINFKNVELKDVLIIYAELRNRTILRPTLLPSPVIQFRTQTALTLEEAVYGLNIVLAMSGLAAVDDGDRFVLIVPLEDATRVGARSPKREQGASLIDPATVPVFPASPAGPAVLPRSAPHIGAALPPPSSPIVPQLGAAQLLAYYAELAKREVGDSGQFGSIAIDFRVQRPLTKTELLYAIERTFALNNLTLVLVGDNAVRLEPMPLKQVKER